MNISYRKATIEDNFNTFKVFLKSIMDYSQRTGVQAITGGQEPEKVQKLWERRRPLWEHLASTSDQYWVAENEKGDVIGYARSIVREDHRELTEFFVLPDNQSAGVGKELLARAFPNDTPHRSIIATSDVRALARYMKAGLYPFTTLLTFNRSPEPLELESDLQIERADNIDTALQATGRLDSVILGHRRDVDHSFLSQDRTLYLYQRDDEVVGYGYINKEYYGPIALLDPNDFPAVLAHAEAQAHALGAETINIEAPSMNKSAIDHFMSRGYHISGFIGSILSEKPFGKLENYIFTSPPFFL